MFCHLHIRLLNVKFGTLTRCVISERSTTCRVEVEVGSLSQIPPGRVESLVKSRDEFRVRDSDLSRKSCCYFATYDLIATLHWVTCDLISCSSCDACQISESLTIISSTIAWINNSQYLLNVVHCSALSLAVCRASYVMF